MRSRSLVLSVSLLSSYAVSQCIPAPGVALTITQDSISPANSIGFAFPFNGATYTDIHISDHGICYLSNAGLPAPPAAVPLVYTPASASLVLYGPVICPFWSDTIPGTAGQFYIEATTSLCTVTWVDVNSFGFPTPLMTFQLMLHSSGNIEFVWGPNVDNQSTWAAPGDNGIVGVSPGFPLTLPAAVDFTTNPTTTDPTFYAEYLVSNTFNMANGKLLLIPAPPGWVAIYTAGGTGCASSEAYGAGCDGLTLVCNPPVLGTSWTLDTSGLNAISVVSFTFLALTRQNPPLPLSAFGLSAPGCEAHVSNPLASVSSTTAGGMSQLLVPVPNTASLAGVNLTAQAAGITPNNGAGLATSNGVAGVIGN